MSASADRWALTCLPLPARLVIAVFLFTAALGYVSSLVLLHFQSAAPGALLPGVAETEEVYWGVRQQPMSKIERLLESTEGPLNGAGTMRPAFTEKSVGWSKQITDKTPEQLSQLMEEREGERRALLSWVRAGAAKEAYDRDDFPLPAELAEQEITAAFLVRDPATDQPFQPRRLHIRSLITRRCVTCHGEDGRHETARLFPLDKYENLERYCHAKTPQTFTLPKLAQTSHAHLLGFALLYGITGLIFSLTAYPTWARLFLGPLPLLVQVLSIVCCWLARLDPLFAPVILMTAALAGLGLFVQIVASLFDLFGKTGRVVVAILLLTGCVGGTTIYVCIIEPHLQTERIAAQVSP